jgi:hypothetical protein
MLILGKRPRFYVRYADVVEASAEFIKTEGSKALEAINSTKKLPQTATKPKPAVTLFPTVKPSESLYKLQGEEFQLQFSNLVKSIFQQSGSVLLRETLIRAIVFQKSQKECLFNEMDKDKLNLELDKVVIVLRKDMLILEEAFDMSLIPFRNVLIKVFGTLDKIKKKDVMEKWQEECGCIPNPGQYTKLMQEFASTKSGGIWILKGLKEQ